MSARLFGPGLCDWTLSASFPEEAGGAWIGGYGRIDLTEPESALGICARLLAELAAPDLDGCTADVRFTIRPATGGTR